MTNNKIKKHEVIERVIIKEIESKILDGTNALEEITTTLTKLDTTIVKKGFGRILVCKKHQKD